MGKYGEEDIKYMCRCIDLALRAEGNTYPNPMVGSVIVYDGKIIGEGYHLKAGGPHAEVHAIASVKHPELLKDSTIYVSLEPCSHFGKTPPCAQRIIQAGIPHVVVGCLDSNAKVSGRGIEQLRAAGVDVKVGVLEEECRELNRRFFTWHEKHRPYIILKWAETRDGFLDINRQATVGGRPTWITSEYARRAVHQWRSREQAIMVGSNTALADNPGLQVRDWTGPNPLRVVIDRNNKLPGGLELFSGKEPTLLFTSEIVDDGKNVEKVLINDGEDPIDAVLGELYKRNIQSLIVEGGSQLLSRFIERNLWDEARVFVGQMDFGDGIKAPAIKGQLIDFTHFDNSILYMYRNI